MDAGHYRRTFRPAVAREGFDPFLSTMSAIFLWYGKPPFADAYQECGDHGSALIFVAVIGFIYLIANEIWFS